MNYDVYGGFEVRRNRHRQGDYDASFWGLIEEAKEGLSGACGCYIFALKNGNNLKPWYVGKAERQPFARECFSVSKKLIYNNILIENNGSPLLFLLPRTTPKNSFCKPTRRVYRDIEFLETMLIGMALEQNPKLANVKKTKLLREMKVPGVINSAQAAPTLPVRSLRNALGLSS